MIAWEAELIGERLSRAEALADAGDPTSLEELEAATAINPADTRLASARPLLHRRLAAALCARATAESDPEAAVAAWEQVLQVKFKHREARHRLGEAPAALRSRLVAAGEAAEAAGDLTGALDAWRRAEPLDADEGLAERIRRVEVARIVAEGRRLYDERRYPEAAFQFRKALSLDPSHEEARRYLEYARGLSAGSSVTGRFQRLE